MGVIVRFPRRHVRASAGSRAASCAIVAAVTPASTTRGADSTAFHHSAGMPSRWCHLRAAETVAPISDAMAPGEAHSPMIERNEVMAISSGIESSLGQIVLIDKAILSYDCGVPFGDNPGMAKSPAKSALKADFIKRVREAREARFKTQGPILELLEIDQGTYKQYESRSFLPYHLVPKFCAATGVDIVWLLTGRGKGPAVERAPEKHKRAAATTQKRGRVS